MANSFQDALKKSAKKKTPTKKVSSVRGVKEVPKKIKDAVDNFLKMNKEIKECNAAKKINEEVILKFSNALQITDGFKDDFVKSYEVPGTKDNSVKVVTSDSFSIDTDDEKEIKKILKDNFSKLISKKYSVKLKNEVFEDEELQKDLIKLLGDRYEDFFDTVVYLETKPDFDKNIFTTISDKKQLENLGVFVKQKKASIK